MNKKLGTYACRTLRSNASGMNDSWPAVINFGGQLYAIQEIRKIVRPGGPVLELRAGDVWTGPPEPQPESLGQIVEGVVTEAVTEAVEETIEEMKGEIAEAVDDALGDQQPITRADMADLQAMDPAMTATEDTAMDPPVIDKAIDVPLGTDPRDTTTSRG